MMTSPKFIELTKSLSVFFAELFQKCAETSEDNVVISPYSIACAVALLSQGANGNTYNQIINALHLPNDKNVVSNLFHELSKKFERAEESSTDELDEAEDSPTSEIDRAGESSEDEIDRAGESSKDELERAEESSSDSIDWGEDSSTEDSSSEECEFEEADDSLTLSVASHIYVQEGSKINEDFVEVAQNKYHSGISALDFANSVESAGTINRWVEIATNDKIQDLITPDTLTSDTELLLVNVLYFKGFWKHAFWESETESGQFYINDTDTIEAQYMHVRDGFDYAILDDLDATAVSLRYIDSDVSFIVILPNKRDGLTELENKLKNYDLAKVIERLSQAEVRVTLPKFKFEFQVTLNDALKKMGMQEMFSNSADFSGMLDKRVKVSEVIHKAFIEVNEEGTEAGAATYGRCILRCLRRYPESYDFTVDHPFLFTISKASTSLFTGRVRKV